MNKVKTPKPGMIKPIIQQREVNINSSEICLRDIFRAVIHFSREKGEEAGLEDGILCNTIDLILEDKGFIQRRDKEIIINLKEVVVKIHQSTQKDI